MKTRSLFLTLAAFSSVLIVLNTTTPGMLQTVENAKITHVNHSQRIQSGSSDTWTLTVYNANCSENGQSAARFFFEFYVDGRMYSDEFNSSSYKTWQCNKGQTISHSYITSSWSAIRPERRDITIRLYWFYNGTAHLEDTASFSIEITVLAFLQHIYATAYLAAYLMACFLLFSYVYLSGLDE